MATKTLTLDLDLYAWQQAALDAWRSNERRGVVEAVTGAGKSRLGLAAIHEPHEHGGRSVVLVPSVALQVQSRQPSSVNQTGQSRRTCSWPRY